MSYGQSCPWQNWYVSAIISINFCAGAYSLKLYERNNMTVALSLNDLVGVRAYSPT